MPRGDAIPDPGGGSRGRLARNLRGARFGPRIHGCHAPPGRGGAGRDLESRIALIRSALDRVRVLAPEVLTRYRQQLAQRLQSAGLEGITVDDERILREVVVFADRSDISEEIARLESHFQQYEDCRKSREAVGRKLDFLAQEFHREINTIGSKANDARIAAEVVLMKTELERFREQVQNLE